MSVFLLPQFSRKSLDAIIRNLYNSNSFGGVAQLARAFEWHSKGQGFETPHLQTPF